MCERKREGLRGREREEEGRCAYTCKVCGEKDGNAMERTMLCQGCTRQSSPCVGEGGWREGEEERRGMCVEGRNRR